MKNQPTDLAGKTAFVTGASSGIGRAIALAIAKEGGKVALCARRQDRLEEVGLRDDDGLTAEELPRPGRGGPALVEQIEHRRRQGQLRPLAQAEPVLHLQIETARERHLPVRATALVEDGKTVRRIGGKIANARDREAAGAEPAGADVCSKIKIVDEMRLDLVGAVGAELAEHRDAVLSLLHAPSAAHSSPTERPFQRNKPGRSVWRRDSGS